MIYTYVFPHVQYRFEHKEKKTSQIECFNLSRRNSLQEYKNFCNNNEAKKKKQTRKEKLFNRNIKKSKKNTGKKKSS